MVPTKSPFIFLQNILMCCTFSVKICRSTPIGLRLFVMSPSRECLHSGGRDWCDRSGPSHPVLLSSDHITVQYHIIRGKCDPKRSSKVCINRKESQLSPECRFGIVRRTRPWGSHTHYVHARPLVMPTLLGWLTAPTAAYIWETIYFINIDYLC